MDHGSRDLCVAEFLEGRQSLGGCGRCLKDCETWPLSGCNVLPSRIWSYVERRSWLVRGEEGRYTEEGTRGKYGGRTRGVIVSDAVFIVVQREEEGRSWKDSSNRSLSTRRRVELSRSWEDFCLLLALFLLSWSLFVTCLPSGLDDRRPRTPDSWKEFEYESRTISCEIYARVWNTTFGLIYRDPVYTRIVWENSL